MKMIAACLLLSVAAPALAAGHPHKKETVACTTGPVTKTYGGSTWLVYGCADGRSVLVISNQGDQNTSEYVMLSPARTGVQVVSEGWGDVGNGNAAFAQLKGMSATDLESLLAETSEAGH